MKKKLLKVSLAILLAIPTGIYGQMTDLIISEYGEGAGNNDYLEIYNGTGTDVDLTNYCLWKIINDGQWYERGFQLQGILPHGQTLNLVKYSADSALLIKVDTVGPVQGVEGSSFTFMVSNGNEAFALAKILAPGDTSIIDKIGDASETEPPAWDCAGVTGAGQEHTWVRKPTVTGPNADWATSAGTTAENSEWIIFPHNYWDNLGFHSEYNSKPASELFFSEYADLGNNDYLEIYNGTHADVDLSNYVIWKIINEGNWGERKFVLDGIIPPGKSYTIIGYKADSALAIKRDTTGPVINVAGSSFTFLVTNGNEAFALARINAPGDTIILDAIGTESETEPPSWDVAGVTGGAKDHTLVRKRTVGGPNPDWTSSAGTNADDSEWIVYPGGYWKNVGKHSMYLGTITPTVDVTFAVDMNQETVAAEGVHIAGNFQGWDPGATVMDDTDADGIWTITIQLEVNKTYEYKFVNGTEWGKDESIPGACAQNNNRFVVVEEADLELDTVCFGSCNACTGLVNVTFRVNMKDQEVSANGVHIAGNFQGWDPGATAMTDDDQDDIYEVTLELGGNTTYEYKYVNGSSWGFEEVVPAECVVNNNRAIDVGASDMTTTAFCFGECNECSTGVPSKGSESILKVYPNPSQGSIELKYAAFEAGEIQVRIYSLTGQLLQDRISMTSTGENILNFSIDKPGLYLIELSTADGKIYNKIIIE